MSSIQRCNIEYGKIILIFHSIKIDQTYSASKIKNSYAQIQILASLMLLDAFRLEDNDLRSSSNKTRQLETSIHKEKMKFLTADYVLKTVKSGASTSQFQ